MSPPAWLPGAAFLTDEDSHVAVVRDFVIGGGLLLGEGCNSVAEVLTAGGAEWLVGAFGLEGGSAVLAFEGEHDG